MTPTLASLGVSILVGIIVTVLGKGILSTLQELRKMSIAQATIQNDLVWIKQKLIRIEALEARVDRLERKADNGN